MSETTEDILTPEASTSPSATSVYEVIALMFEQASALAWQKLGLQPDYATGLIAPDLIGAKVAIDLAAHLGDVLLPQLDGEDRRQIGNVVRDLRLNYVGRTS